MGAFTFFYLNMHEELSANLDTRKSHKFVHPGSSQDDTYQSKVSTLRSKP